MKLIFLDIDGVLNSFDGPVDLTIEHNQWNPELLRSFGIGLELVPSLIERVNKITEVTKARIVLSSSWRIGYLADWADVIIALHNAGLKGFIVGRTPWGKDDPRLRTRGGEIAAWFKEHPDEKVESFIILDDSDDIKENADRHVRTDYKLGIQDKDVKLAIEMLNGS